MLDTAQKNEECQFGGKLILPTPHADAVHKAAACFAALPDLTTIAIWTKPNLRRGALGRCRLEHDCTFFWMRRTCDDMDPNLILDDVTDDAAAGACFRFIHVHDTITQHLAADHGLDDKICAVFFARSGFSYLVHDAENLFDQTLDQIAHRKPWQIAPSIHPVFPEEPSGHQEIAWISAVWHDLEDLAPEGGW